MYDCIMQAMYCACLLFTDSEHQGRSDIPNSVTVQLLPRVI